jgi:hypothetical protein
MKMAPLSLGLAAALFAAALAAQPPATPAPPQFSFPARMANPRVLPADTSPERLRDIMRGFAVGLGVRCSFCHVGTEGQPLTTFDFASDANPHKEIARGMMRMVWRLNQEQLPAIAGLSAPQVSCYTCHRGAEEPATAPPPRPAAPAATTQ